MRFLDHIRIRQLVALIVIPPALVGAMTSSLMAKGAIEDRQDAQLELADLETLTVARDLRSAAVGELSMYQGWSDAERDFGDGAVSPLLLAMEDGLVARVRGVGDRATLAAERADLEPSDQAASAALAMALDRARDAYDQRDLTALEIAADEAEAQVARLDVSARQVVRRRGQTWISLDRQSNHTFHLVDEITATITTLLAGPPSEIEVRDAAVRADRTDTAFDELLAAASATQVEQLRTANDADTSMTTLRSYAFGDQMGEQLQPLTLIPVLAQVQAFTDVLEEVRESTAAELRAEADARADAATTKAIVLVVLAISFILVPGAMSLVVGGRLSRRVEALGAAAGQMSAGELGVFVDGVDGRNELAVLGQAFNEVSATVATSHAQISALADGRLDDPILERELPGHIGRTLRAALRRLGQLTRDLAHHAQHDNLTGLLDRRGLEVGLEHSSPSIRWTLALIDLDGFKEINDTHGHAAGDAVLVAVAERLASSVRANDLVARLGGDEFVVMSCQVDLETSSSIARRMIASIARGVGWEGHEFGVTASIGWTQLGDGESFGNALGRADGAMYEAKRAGKNRAFYVAGPEIDGVEGLFEMLPPAATVDGPEDGSQTRSGNDGRRLVDQQMAAKRVARAISEST